MDNKLVSLQTRQQQASRREAQKQAFRRNQALGLLLLAAAVLAYRLLHTPAGWIFPAGWWKLW